ncbi:hypothetical protein [Streptomyces sp. NPDC050548]|uniref:hypothetical protein n=1 Tax=Streptomyces sp. NPDC050548 TaxID=3365629 RepID=UPI0037A520BE
MGAASSQPSAAVAGLSLALAFLISLVIALTAVIINRSPGSRFVDILPMAATVFAASMGIALASLAGLGLLRS